MNDYASGFFAGGGVPPLALTGPLPAGPEAMKRAQADIKRAVDAAKKNSEPVFPIPAGYTLAPVGVDPEKGQMTEARLFQIQEIARVYGIPPAFLQDLSRGTFANVEQQDLNLVKHLVAQWAGALEGEMNLKLFGRLNKEGKDVTTSPVSAAQLGAVVDDGNPDDAAPGRRAGGFCSVTALSQLLAEPRLWSKPAIGRVPSTRRITRLRLAETWVRCQAR